GRVLWRRAAGERGLPEGEDGSEEARGAADAPAAHGGLLLYGRLVADPPRRLPGAGPAGAPPARAARRGDPDPARAASVAVDAGAHPAADQGAGLPVLPRDDQPAGLRAGELRRGGPLSRVGEGEAHQRA